MFAQEIRTRVWRDGTLEAENVPFEQVSDYLAEPECLVWADLLNPDADTLCQLAEELSLDPHAVEKKLTSWAAIIAVPTAVIGYFGQNVPYPGFMHESGFRASLVVKILIASALYVTFRRKDWL